MSDPKAGNTPPAPPAGMTPANVAHLLQGAGLVLDLGAMRVRVHSPLSDLPEAISRVYRHFPLIANTGFDDCVIDLLPAIRLHRPWNPGVRFLADGSEPFEPLPKGMTLPQLEWGLNWVFAHLFSRHFLLHSGTLERAGLGLLLVATPGSGKSTLTAALALSGFRVLSDEFGVLRLADAHLLPIAKPIALKNASIDLIRQRFPEAVLGPTYFKTHKGNVAHLALPLESVLRRHEPVRPSIIVFPSWIAGASLELTPVRPARALQELVTNSFNYGLLGERSFHAACDLVSGCDCYRLTYGSLDEAIPLLSRLCDERALETAS